MHDLYLGFVFIMGALLVWLIVGMGLRWARAIE